MQTRLRRMIVMGLGGLVTAGNAFAVAPAYGAAYSGTGVDYVNDHSGWTADGTGAVSLQTSRSGRSVTDFRGGYSFYCGSGTATVTDHRMPISRRGTFGTRFAVVNRGPRGKRNGMAYVQIRGTFSRDRTSARVSYLVDYVFKGRHVKHPYDTGQPRRLGCASWVRGTVPVTTSSTGSLAGSPPQPQSRPRPNPPTATPNAAAAAEPSRLLSS